MNWDLTSFAIGWAVGVGSVCLGFFASMWWHNR